MESKLTASPMIATTITNLAVRENETGDRFMQVPFD